MKEYPRILFFGTPDFAVASLDALLLTGYPVIGVVTAPDKPAGRGRQLSESAVKRYAIQKDLALFQPDNLKNATFQEEMLTLKPDLQVVVAFRMLPKEIWSIPPLGTFNLHASLLPDYRGAAPINWVLINGETETGVTTFFIEETIDTGKILFAEKTPIHADENAGELHDRLMNIGASLVVKTTEAIVNKIVTGIPQAQLSPSDSLKKAPKILKEHCRINWDKQVEQVFNLIRGMSPHPGAYTELFSVDNHSHYVKVFKAEKEISLHSQVPGHISTDGKTYLKIAVQDGFIHLLEVQPAGRKVMNNVEFLNGFGKHFSGSLR